MHKFTYEPGRNIYVDGVPFISVNREGDTYPAEADATTRLIVKLLNKHRRSVKLYKGHGSVSR